MIGKRKGLVAIILFVSISLAAMKPNGNAGSGNNLKSDFKNLKVLPRDIGKKELSEIMVDEFQEGLGVSCNFCHTENKETHQPDYASDEKPEKAIARAMMRMELKLNKKYFKLRKPIIGDPELIITCETCHRGKPVPEKE